jgi:hypothetical protein
MNRIEEKRRKRKEKDNVLSAKSFHIKRDKRKEKKCR